MTPHAGIGLLVGQSVGCLVCGMVGRSAIILFKGREVTLPSNLSEHLLLLRLIKVLKKKIFSSLILTSSLDSLST